MKGMFLGLFLTIVSLAVHADDFRYMAFQASDGTTRTVSLDGLKISFEGETLIATAGSEEVSVSLSNLAKMFFTDTPAGIDTPTVPGTDADDVVVYNLQGMCVGRLQAQPKGIYIVKLNGQTRKVTVK